MSQIPVNIPGYKIIDGQGPIIILGPNGSGKTQLAQRISREVNVSPISAQRRTWVDESLPVQEENQLKSNKRHQIDQWKQYSWQPTQEINFILSELIQDHTNVLTLKNEEARRSGTPHAPVNDTKLILLQDLWSRLFPNRKLEIGGYFPKARRLEAGHESTPYQLRQMSDGERTILYMAARILTTEENIILIDEPELHMHSRLAIKFWDEIEKLRPESRFIYITHDLNFTLSRKDATILILQGLDPTEIVEVNQLTETITAEVLGAATLPFYAKRIIAYEGEQGIGFARNFFSLWFDDDSTYSIPCGGRDSVCASVHGINSIGVKGAEVIGLVDRDFYSDEINTNITDGVRVLKLHEIESILCDKELVEIVALHLGKNFSTVWPEFLNQVRDAYRGKSFVSIVSRRVRSRVGDLLNGSFKGADIVDDLDETIKRHINSLDNLNLLDQTRAYFQEEKLRVSHALENGDVDMLVILPGKHLLNILSRVLGFRETNEYTSLVLQSLNRKDPKHNQSIITLGERIETALVKYLPPRRI